MITVKGGYCKINAGDTNTISVPLDDCENEVTSWDQWNLYAFFKLNEDDTDEEAVIQKITGTGITTDGDNAIIEFVYPDTVEQRGVKLLADIRGENISTGAAATFNKGFTVEVGKPIVQHTDATIPIYTTNPSSIEERMLAAIDGATITPEALILSEFPPDYVPQDRQIGLKDGQLAIGDGVAVNGNVSYVSDPMRVVGTAYADSLDLANSTSVIPFGRVPITASQAIAGKTLIIKGTISGITNNAANACGLRICFDLEESNFTNGFIALIDGSKEVANYNLNLRIPLTSSGSVLSMDSCISNSESHTRATRTIGAMDVNFFGEVGTDIFISNNNGVTGVDQEIVVGFYIDAESISAPGSIASDIDLQFRIE